MYAQKKRSKKSDNKENEPETLAPIELKRAKTIAENQAVLASLGLGDKAPKAPKKRDAEAAKEARQAKKRQKIEENWTALCRVGSMVKVPGSTFENVEVPEVHSTSPPPTLPRPPARPAPPH